MFVPGFMSSMDGTNAQVIERFCKLKDYSFVRYKVKK
jgi:hypothetical protein